MTSFHSQVLAIALLAVAGTSLQSQGVVQPTKEYRRPGNVPPPMVGSSEEPKGARQQQRASVKEQAKAGEIINSGQTSYARDQQQKVTGTHESRSAERKDKRAETKAVNKTGQMPVMSEADAGKVKAQ